jgi:cyclopropane fatty-acyl-phospholipid synthase-like methyltransferase
VVLDYGCGIGRLAKAMIDASGCSVVGLDTSPEMRKLADDYVGSDRFIAVSPSQFDALSWPACGSMRRSRYGFSSTA